MFKRVLILFLIFTIMCSMFVSVMGQGSSETYVDLVTENFNDIAGTLLSTKGWKANLALDEELSAEYKIADNGGFQKNGSIQMYRSVGKQIDIEDTNSEYWISYDFAFDGVEDFSGIAIGDKYKIGVEKVDDKVLPVIWQDPNGATETSFTDEFDNNPTIYIQSDNAFSRELPDNTVREDYFVLQKENEDTAEKAEGYVIYEVSNLKKVEYTISQSNSIKVFPNLKTAVSLNGDQTVWTDVTTQVSAPYPSGDSQYWNLYDITATEFDTNAKYLKLTIPKLYTTEPPSDSSVSGYANCRVRKIKVTSNVAQQDVVKSYGTTQLENDNAYTALIRIRPWDDSISLMVYDATGSMKAEWDIETEDKTTIHNFSSIGFEANTTGGFSLTRFVKEELAVGSDASKAYLEAQYNAKINDIKAKNLNDDTARSIFEEITALETEITTETGIRDNAKQTMLGSLSEFKSDISEVYLIAMNRVSETFDDVEGTLLSTKGWWANSELDESLSSDYKIAENGGFVKDGDVAMYRSVGDPISINTGNEYWFTYDFLFNRVEGFTGLTVGSKYKFGVDVKDGKVFPVISQDSNGIETERTIVDDFNPSEETVYMNSNNISSRTINTTECDATVAQRTFDGEGYVIYEVQNPKSAKIYVMQSPAVAAFPRIEISEDFNSWVSVTGDSPVYKNTISSGWKNYEIQFPNIPQTTKYVKVIMPEALDSNGLPTAVWNNRFEKVEITCDLTQQPIVVEWGRTELSDNIEYTALVRIRPSDDTVALMFYEKGQLPKAQWDVKTTDYTMSVAHSTVGFEANTTSGFKLNRLVKEELPSSITETTNMAFETMLRTKYLSDIENAKTVVDGFYNSIAKSYMQPVVDAYYTENQSIVPIVEYVTITGATNLTATTSVLDVGKNLKELVYKWYVRGQLIGTGISVNASSYTGNTVSLKVTPYNKFGVAGITKTASITISATSTGGSFSAGGGGGGISTKPENNKEDEKVSVENNNVISNNNSSFNSTVFNDINGHWAKNEIEKMAKIGVIKGIGNNNFAPEQFVTRAECAVMILRLINQNLTNAESSGMKDIPYGAWYQDSVNTIVNIGIMSGYNGYFNPENPITREELAKVMASVYKYMGNSVLSEAEISFRDTTEISDWALPYIKECIKAGLMNGMDDGCFNPRGNTTRAQMAVVLSRLENRQ